MKSSLLTGQTGMRSMSHGSMIMVARLPRSESPETSSGQAGASYLPDGLPAEGMAVRCDH
ncbi:hypothetical protein [Pleomorphovibrio marinus]|uniref:hypothetical protein n=1 Tax=Pleomorphovibrio marinus TaxID=2164132 RepID=UPI0013004896|nr:hypothetical protein [Pleomorphovibrio marinus]